MGRGIAKDSGANQSTRTGPGMLRKRSVHSDAARVENPGRATAGRKFKQQQKTRQEHAVN